MTPSGRRRLASAGLVLAALCVCGVLLWLQHLDRVPKGRPRTATLPTMGAPRSDTGHPRAVEHAAENEFATIQCAVSTRADLHVPPGRLLATAVESDDADPGTVLTGTANGNELILTVPAGRWTLAWGIGNLPTGFPLGTVDLVEGDVFRCAVAPDGVPVSGVVVDTRGNPLPALRIDGCGPRHESDASGRFAFTVPFAALRGPERTCSLRARFEDGLLARYSAPASVSALTPGPFTLTVDASPVAGMGVSLRQTDGGLSVGYVHPGTPAEDADLRAGDRILAVDGHDTEGMTAMEFIPLGVGAEGSTIVLEIERDGEQIRKSFRRERIVKLEDTGGPR